MTLNRFAARSDTSQRGIVRSLRDTGMMVWTIRRPCDLLLRFWCTRHQQHCWQPLEIKTPTATGAPRRRRDQHSQSEFLRETNTPVAATFEQAWHELNTRHRLGAIQVPDPLQPIKEIA